MTLAAGNAAQHLQFAVYKEIAAARPDRLEDYMAKKQAQKRGSAKRSRPAGKRDLVRREAIPIELDIRKYEIAQVRGGHAFTIVGVATSRIWMTAAFQQFVVGRRFHLAPKAAAAARLLM